MKRILLSAFACDPEAGSEGGNGWHWANTLASRGLEVHCITRGAHKENIEKYEKPDHLIFHYVTPRFGLDKLYYLHKGPMYIHYVLWQWLTYKKAKRLHQIRPFEVAHHVTWGSLQLGSFLYKLPIPFIFGPCGGGQQAPIAFKSYFNEHWDSEKQREKVGQLLMRYNPGSRGMLRSAKALLVSNMDTMQMAKKAGAEQVFMSLDAAIPSSFIPETFVGKDPTPGILKLLWVGRLMPRKGLALVIDVMQHLKSYPGIKLTVVGDGEMRNSIEERIANYGLQETVELKGRIPYEVVGEYYGSHDLFFFTSLRDSGGSQLIEAMAYGMPIVTIDLHGQGTIVSDQTGIRCKCDTPEMAIEELKNAILDLYHSPEKISQMSVAAHAFAKEQTWETKVKKIIQSYYPLGIA